MSYISQVEIKNFQSWEHGVFDLSPNVNIFLGESDHGKSAIFRAIEWIRTNRPLGNEFCSDWSEQDWTEATIRFQDDSFITRRQRFTDKKRSTTENQYILPGLKDPLKAFGTEVPEEVTRIFNMSDVNIQSQDDQHFLLNDNPAEVGRKLNQVASLSDIDKSFTAINSKIKILNSEIKRDEKSLKSQQEELQNFLWVDNADKDLKALEQKQGYLSKLQEKERNIRNARDKIVTINDKLKDLNKYIKAENSVNSLIQSYNVYLEYTKKSKVLINYEDKLIDIENASKVLIKIITADRLLQRMVSLCNEHRALKDKVLFLSDRENRLADINDNIKTQNNIIKADVQISGLYTNYVQYQEMYKQYNALVDKEDKLKGMQEFIESGENDIEKLENEYNKLKPETCPLCQQEWIQ